MAEIEERVARLEGIMEEIRTRVGEIHLDIRELREGLRAVLDRMAKSEDRMAKSEERIARMEGIMEEIRTRVGNMEARFEDLAREMRGNFRWLLGIMVTMWVTIILAVLLK